jgi:hypothetical protein
MGPTTFRIPKRKISTDPERDVKPKVEDASSSEHPVTVDLDPPALAGAPPAPASAARPASAPSPSPAIRRFPGFMMARREQPQQPPAGDPAAQQMGAGIPEGWLECPKGGLASALHGICAIKTPMSATYTQHLPIEERWTPMDAVMACGARKVRSRGGARRPQLRAGGAEAVRARAAFLAGAPDHRLDELAPVLPALGAAHRRPTHQAAHREPLGAKRVGALHMT